MFVLRKKREGGKGMNVKVGTDQDMGKGGSRYITVKYIGNIHLAITARMEPLGKPVIIVTGAGNCLVNQSTNRKRE